MVGRSGAGCLPGRATIGRREADDLVYTPAVLGRPKHGLVWIVAAAIVSAAATTAIGAATSRTSVARVTVNLKSRNQVIDGFGMTWRVWNDPHLSNQGQSATTVPAAAQAAILKNLYQTLGLTRARPFLDPGAEQAAGAAWDFRRTDAHAALIQQARRFGLETVLPAPVYLETWILQSRSSSAYVDWAMTVLQRLRADGATVPYYSPLNEPQIDGDFPPSWMHDVVVGLGGRLRAAGLETKLVIPDDENPTDAYRRAVAVLEDPNARRYVGALAYHIYKWSTDDVVRMRQLARRYELPLWMTEYSSPSYLDWSSSFEWAVQMHTLLTTGGVNAVDYLWGFFGSWTQPNTMLSISFRNGVYQSYTPMPTYWITGQYSRYVRPGSRRVGATSSNGVLASGYVQGKHVVTVLLNPSGSPQTARISFTGGFVRGAVRAVQSSASEHWTELPALRAANGTLSTTLPPQSITTFLAARG